MSRTFSIGCTQCRKHLWIAQASAASGKESTTLYTGEGHVMAALKDFLFDHHGHPLIFDDNCNSELADWEEIDPPRRDDVDPLRAALTTIRQAGNDSEQTKWMQKVAAHALEPGKWPSPGNQPLAG